MCCGGGGLAVVCSISTLLWSLGPGYSVFWIFPLFLEIACFKVDGNSMFRFLVTYLVVWRLACL